jgi:hypothetical protein
LASRTGEGKSTFGNIKITTTDAATSVPPSEQIHLISAFCIGKRNGLIVLNQEATSLYGQSMPFLLGPISQQHAFTGDWLLLKGSPESIK